MLIKWIVCTVAEEMKENFSLAQSKWSAIAGSPGLIGQLGGWDLKNQDTACILSLWKDDDSFDNFMENIHDTVTDSNDQLSTLQNIKVEFFYPQVKMPGTFADLESAIPEGRYLRVADCLVKKERVANFLDAQESVWIPAMSASEGMLGGSFNKDRDKGQHFLVTTLWSTEEDHTRYAENKVPELRLRADVSNDLESITGRFIRLEDSWTVLPK